MRPPWNTTDEELRSKIGPGEVMHAVPWSSLTPEQKRFQRTKMAIHAAMITRMDREIGRVLAQLKAMNAYDDTLILFVSDNGASSEQLIRADGHDASAPPGSAASHLCLGPGWSSAANTPFRLHKSWVHEGGISSPWIMHWPKGIRDAGGIRHNPCHLIDIVPTMISLAGGKPEMPAGAPPMAGKSLVPALTRDDSVRRDFLYFHHSNNRAVRAGDYKIVSAGKGGPWELYDMRTDRAESNNLAEKQSGRVSQMAALWQQMEDALVRHRESSRPVNKSRLLT
jgi:arylsulfatase